MRSTLVKQLLKIAAKDKDLILLTSDLGFMVFEEFAAQFPKQFVNVGIAEANMIGVATGLALSGKKVVAYSISNFTVFRPFEQIRNGICRHKAPVVLIGSGAGFSYGFDGMTHYGTEDISLMRSLPNMTVLCPADVIETNWATKAAISLKSPVYLRIGKSGEPDVHQQNHPYFKIGTGVQIKTGKDFAIIATGNIVFNSLEAAKGLERQGLSGRVISMHTVKPIDKKLILQLAKEVPFIITAEEHITSGGLGGAVAEIISQIHGHKAEMLILGIDNFKHNRVGSQFYLREIHGLSPKKLTSSIKKFVWKKNKS